MPNLGKLEAIYILKELKDLIKAESKILSSIKGKMSWEMTSEGEKIHGMFLRANCDQYDISIGVLSQKLHEYRNIRLINAGEISISRLNRDFYHKNLSCASDKKRGRVRVSHSLLLVKIQ